jgi:hypothetical protein
VTNREPFEEEPGPETGPEGPPSTEQELGEPEEPPEKRQSVKGTAHLRPLPIPRPDERRFDTPSKLPETRPLPPKPKPPPSKPKPTADPKRPPKQITFPVAKPPPGVPQKPSSDPAPAPARPDQVTAPADAEAKVRVDEDQALEAKEVPGEEVSEEAGARRGSLYGFVLYLALAVGTLPLPGEARYVLLWVVLLGLGGLLLLFDEDRPLGGSVDPLQLTWGLGVGFVLSLPLMLTASRALARTSHALVPIEGVPSLFQALMITWPLGETLFYRGAVQREHGLVVAALVAGLGNLLLYMPETGGVFAVLFVAVIFATALAFIYGYVRQQYGLAAAYACQVMTNLMLIFLPRLLVPGA